MPTVNEQLLESSISHQIDIDHYSNGVVRRIIALLNRVDSDLFAQLQSVLDDMEGQTFTVQRLEKLLESVRALNAQAYESIGKELAGELKALTEYEVGYQHQLFSSMLPVQVSIASVPPKQVYAAAMARPFQGRLLREWLDGLEESRAAKVRDAIRIGYVEGETNQQIITRIRGTKALNYADGLLDISRRDAEAIVRTSVAHTANYSRQHFMEANTDIIKGVKWIATLDARTTPTCFPGSVFALPVGELRGVFRRDWNGDVIVVTTATGKKLRATPNHPVLTPRGWRPIQELRPCEDVLYRVSVDVAGVETAKDIEVPATISAIFDALNKPAFCDVLSKSSTEVDFHGDGVRGDYEINHPSSESHLRLALNTFFGQEDAERLLVFVAGSSILSALGKSDEIGLGWLLRNQSPKLYAGSIEGCIKAGFADFKVPADIARAHPSVERRDDCMDVGSPVCFAPSEGGHDTSSLEHSSDGGSGYAVAPADFGSGCSVGVLADDVVSVEREFFSGHVYNLSTDTELYIADGFVVHNCRARDGKIYPVDSGPRPPAHIRCRSSISPVTKSWQEMGIDLPEKDAGTRASMDGQVPGDMNYAEWLAKKPAAFQDEVLGATRGRLFRDGKMPLTSFVNNAGREYTLDDLRKRDAAAFKRAGL